jgi:hypothetical protein
VSTPDQLQVLFHAPGPRWRAGVEPRDQEGIELHYDFVGRLAAEGLVVLAGRFSTMKTAGWC